jgi:hypothetical protein
MRFKPKFFGLLFLFMVTLSAVSAGPLIRGYFIEKLPEKATSKTLASDKGIVLAHVFNYEKSDMMPGSYKVGVEIIGKNGSKKTYAVAPNDVVETGMMKTFRLAIPIADVDKNNGKFRVFSRIGEASQWSDLYSFLPNIQVDGDKQITTLYVEAPSMDKVQTNKLALTPRDNAPVFEKIQLESILKDEQVYQTNNKTVKKTAKKSNLNNTAVAALPAAASATKAAAVAKTAAIASKQPKVEAPKEMASAQKAAVVKTKEKVAEKTTKRVANEPKVEVAKAVATKPEIVKADVVVKRVNNVNPNEFKKLKTIDEELIIYVIKEGDTLKSIASKYYGNPSKERAIADLNFIELTSSIKVGEEIIVDVRPLTKS